MTTQFDSPETLGTLGPDEGHALVNRLYAAGALACIDYVDHDECVWHHQERADALLAPTYTQPEFDLEVDDFVDERTYGIYVSPWVRRAQKNELPTFSKHAGANPTIV